MQHVKPVIVKFLIYSILISIVLLFYGFSISSLLLLSALLSITTYIVGDLFVLPLQGNIVATVADGAIIFLGVLVWMVPSYGLYFSTVGGALFVAFILSVSEWFLHIYMIGRLKRDDHEPVYD